MVKFKDSLRPLSVFQVLFKANLMIKDFSSLWEPINGPAHEIMVITCKFMFRKFMHSYPLDEERGGSVEECLTGD